MARSQQLDISSSTIFRTILILLGFWFLYFIRDIVLVLIAAVVISAGVEPIANYLERYRIPRALSVVLVYVLVLIVLSTAVTLLVPPLAAQVRSLAQALPELVQQVEQWGVRVAPADQQELVTQLQSVLTQFGNNLANASFNIFQQTRNVVAGFISTLFAFIVAFYLVVEKDALKKMFRIILPRDHVAYVDRIITRAQRSIGRWMLGQLVLALIMGVVVGLALWAVGVEYALALGLLTAVMEIIPVIGPIIAAIPGVLVGFSQSFVIGLLALGVYVLAQQAENNILVPNIMKRAVGLNPLVTLLAVLLGGRLAGVVGVILAVPIATILSIFLSDLFDTQERDAAA